jgi:transcriptional regulator with XRE-family HTH domain
MSTPWAEHILSLLPLIKINPHPAVMITILQFAFIKAGWTQAYMAVHTGIGRAHISNLETGKKEAGLRALEILADSFGMSLPKLLSRI